MRHQSSAVRLAIAFLALLAPVTATIAGPPAAGKAKPFKGTVQTAEVLDFTGFPTAVTSSAIGTGHATRLGNFTVTWVVEIDFSTPGGAAIGSGVYTAANGDQLFVDLVGHGSPTEDPDVISIVDVQTVTGGTGRFAGATGVFTREAFSNLVTGLTSGSFDGTIVFAN
jgi:hypothetical protein